MAGYLAAWPLSSNYILWQRGSSTLLQLASLSVGSTVLHHPQLLSAMGRRHEILFVPNLGTVWEKRFLFKKMTIHLFFFLRSRQYLLGELEVFVTLFERTRQV